MDNVTYGSILLIMANKLSFYYPVAQQVTNSFC